jgi:hypothetical protein
MFCKIIDKTDEYKFLVIFNGVSKIFPLVVAFNFFEFFNLCRLTPFPFMFTRKIFYFAIYTFI